MGSSGEFHTQDKDFVLESAIGQPRTLELLGSDHKQAPAEIQSPRGLLCFPLWEEGYTCPPLSRSMQHVAWSTIFLLPLVVLRSRIRVLTTLFASGVQSRLSSRTSPDHLRQTLLHQAMIEVFSVRVSAVSQVRLRSDAKGAVETLELLSEAPLCSEFIKTPEPQGPAETLKKIDVSAHWNCNKSFVSSVPGRFWWGTEGFRNRISPLFGTVCDVLPTARDSKHCNLHPRSSYVLYLWLLRFYKYGSFYVDDCHQCRAARNFSTSRACL